MRQFDILTIAQQVENVEIGYANNKQAIRGRDFHFNADILAGDKIESVQIKILPKADQTYTSSWKMEIDWSEFIGLKFEKTFMDIENSIYKIENSIFCQYIFVMKVFKY